MKSKIFIIVLILVLPLQLSAKNLERLHVICTTENKKYVFTPFIGLSFFKNNKIKLHHDAFSPSKGLVIMNAKGNYHKKDFQILIQINDDGMYIGKYSLDRISGILNKKFLTGEVDFNCDQILNNEKYLIKGMMKLLKMKEEKYKMEQKQLKDEHQEKLKKRKF